MAVNFPRKNKQQVKKEILEYIRLETAKGRYPTHSELEEKFRTNISTHFSGIREAYQLANVSYKRQPDPFLKYEKEQKLASISVGIFRKMGYMIEKVSIGPQGKGPDVILKNKNGELIPVEIKAYQKFGKIKDDLTDHFSKYFTNEIAQLLRYETQLGSPYGFLVTSTDRKTFQHVNKRVRILFSKDIKKLLIENKMEKHIETLNWIRETAGSVEKEEKYKAVQDAIVTFVKKQLLNRNYTGKREIQARFRIDLESYFRSMKKVYESAGIDPYSLSHARMGGQVDKERFKEKMETYVRNEVRGGRSPTYKEIQGKFQCLPKAFFPRGIREIYELAGIPYIRKFAAKTSKEKEEGRQRIVNYVRAEASTGYLPTWRDIENELSVAVLNYFKGMREIYQVSGITLPNRKGLSH